MENLEELGLTEHLRDLRRCLIVSLLATGAGFALTYSFIEPVGAWYLKPLYDVLPQESTLIFTSYQEAFFFI